MQDHSIPRASWSPGKRFFPHGAITDSSIAGIASGLAAEAESCTSTWSASAWSGVTNPCPYHHRLPTGHSAIEKACADHGNLTFSIIDSHVAAHKLGLHTPLEDNRSDFLFLHLLATDPPRQQFAGETHRHDFRLAQIRQGIIAVGLIALLGGLLFAGKETYTAYSLREEADSLKNSEADLNWRYQEFSATFPQLGIDNETLRRLTTRHSELSRQQRLPDQAYALVSRALTQTPGVTLEALDWKIGTAGKTGAPSTDASDEVTTVRGASAFGHASPGNPGHFEQFA